MAMTFDLRKDVVNKKKHGISLSRAKDFDFAAATYILDNREDYGEIRYRAVSFLDARLYSLVFTQIDETMRVISLRKASKHEEKEYEESQRKD